MTNERSCCPGTLTDQEFYTRLYHKIIVYQKPFLTLQDAEDCASVLVTKLWVKHRAELEDYRQGKRPENWLRVSSRNAAINFKVQQEQFQCIDLGSLQVDAGGRPPLETMSQGASLEGGAIASELYLRLATAMSQLPQTTRDTLLRHYVQDESWVEIARSLGDTPDNIRQKVGRALHAIRKKLEAEGLMLVEANDYLAIIASPGGT
ncbi:MAG: hypothetical protein JWN14_1938 [Chthonomonadales bacterium]|nr:hypothetical protein [Chthonomonadales bacterium]